MTSEKSRTRLQLIQDKYESPGYWPFIDILGEYLAWGPEDDEETRAESIISSLSEMVNRGDLSEEQMGEIGPFLGNLLSVEFGNELDERMKNLSPEQMRHRTFKAIRDFFVALSKEGPTLLVFEDLHWGDSLSIDLISLLMEALDSGPLLLLCVYRPEREHECWRLGTIAARKCPDHYTELGLRELSSTQSRQLVESLLAIEDLPFSVKDMILAKSQGNPYFVEEVVRSLIDSGMVYREGDFWRAHKGIESVEVPESLQRVILSRVDYLEDNLKHVIHKASVIGRLFRRRVLEHTLTEKTDLEEVLWKLEDHGLVYKERATPEEEYSFKHVLTREAVYQSLIESTRRKYHGHAAQVLEEHFPEVPEIQPELLAHHYTEAGLNKQAVLYWHRAGRKATGRSANVEAIGHFTKGLAILETLPDTDERARNEIELQIGLGPALMTTKGYAAAEVERVYLRALKLCKQVGETSMLFQSLWGLWRCFQWRAQYGRARELGEGLLSLAESEGETDLLLEAHTALGITLFWLGELPSARAHLEECISRYNPGQHRLMFFLYSQDPGVTCLSYSAWILWMSGYPDQALERIDEALNLAQGLSHPFSIALAIDFAGYLGQLQREVGKVQKQARELIALSQQEDFTRFFLAGIFLQGWVLTERGRVEEGIEKMLKGMNTRMAMGEKLVQSWLLCCLAETYGKAGRIEEGLDCVAEGLAVVEETGEGPFEAELYRIKGELLLSRGAGEQGSLGAEERGSSFTSAPLHLRTSAQAHSLSRHTPHPLDLSTPETCFHKALEVARRHGAKSWELRAATSLGRLWKEQGKKEKAVKLLGEVYERFTEGYGTKDLKEAKALLEELR